MRFRVRVTATWPDVPSVTGERDIRAVSRRHALDKALRVVAADYPDAPEHAAEIIDGPAQGGPAVDR